jgi:hypothetical protein
MLNLLKINGRIYGNHSRLVNVCLYVVLHIHETTVVSFGASTDNGLTIMNIFLLVTKNKLSPGVLVCAWVCSASDAIHVQMKNH